MKILHTSDWHLGQKFLHFDRIEEHQLALNWLFECIQKEQVEMLIIAGDVFDIGNPPNYARQIYYRFLTKLRSTACRHIIVIGGNHDSPAMLNAPADLLKTLNVHVIGAAPENIDEEIIVLRNAKEEIEAVVAAVPFLRDRDLHYSQAGEGGVDRVDRVKTGICKHYHAVGALVEAFAKFDIPKLATGHLYATGAQASDKQDNIYIGDKENIKADQFPAIFDYVALGHIHRSQKVGEANHIRYCGSIIPLSFSETKDEKGVLLLSFEGASLKEVSNLKVPVFRRLKTIQGDIEEVKVKLRKFAEKGDRSLRPWVEVIVETEELLPRLDLDLQDFVASLELDLIKIRVKRKHQALHQQVEEPDLENLDVLEVFQKKCSSYGAAPENIDELEQVFLELQDWMKNSYEN
ncbi:MAG: exonuclease SbcCD subunit D C-terminal domain-containing protein [Saprospiraceae bacterium]|nr:exonuclease SbcCD subunit D C-terminal domain-containing protein [Saprospiraceae bacterium]